MPTPEKQEIIEEIKGKLSSSQIAILTEFQGLKVAEMTELRKLLQKADIDYKVYKNTLIGLAAKELGITGLDRYLVGSTALAFSKKDDLATPSKVLKDFGAKHQYLKIKAGVLNSKAINADDVNSLVNLPPKEYIISMVLGGMQAPIMKLLGVLQAPLRDLASVLKNLADKRGAGETADNAPTPSEDQESQNKAEENSQDTNGSDQQTSES
ncbi:MAG: 50S ribosomal protein L10 [Candidatus Poribacteria bacterium]